MRIAQIAPLAESVPPKLYGGTERAVSWLTEELVRQGHDVTLFASGDSSTSATLVAGAPRSLRLAGIADHTASILVMLDQVRRRADEFDVIHFHVDLLQFPQFQTLFHKCVTTLHGRLDLPDFHPVYRAFPGMPLVSISENQRIALGGMGSWLANIPHGIPGDLLNFQPHPGKYLAFLGRIAHEKGPDRAIEIAKRSGVPLKIAAKIDHVDRRYFDKVIAPLLDDPLIEFVGEIDDTTKAGFLGNALALLFPIDWPEPFGLVMIEAMSVGTPVIAWRRGSVPEIIDDGVTGVVVESIEASVAAVADIASLSRSVIRKTFESRFSASQMASRYVAAYEKLLSPPLAFGASAPIATRTALGQTHAAAAKTQ